MEFDRGDNRFHRLRHYCRVLQFVGLPDSAFRLYKYANQYLEKKKSLYRTIFKEKEDRGRLESIVVDGDVFLGRWFDSWLPAKSKRYSKLYSKEENITVPLHKGKRYIFQGLRRDVYEAGLEPEPFKQELFSNESLRKYHKYQESNVSVFSDGTIMVFRQE